MKTIPLEKFSLIVQAFLPQDFAYSFKELWSLVVRTDYTKL
jgi:hypothetical protein